MRSVAHSHVHWLEHRFHLRWHIGSVLLFHFMVEVSVDGQVQPASCCSAQDISESHRWCIPPIASSLARNRQNPMRESGAEVAGGVERRRGGATESQDDDHDKKTDEERMKGVVDDLKFGVRGHFESSIKEHGPEEEENASYELLVAINAA